MVDTIVGALLPVVFTLLLGVAAATFHDEDDRAAGALNTMVLHYALPLALFAGTAAIPRQALVSQLPLAGLLALGMVVPYALAYGVSRHVFGRPVGDAALQALGFGFPAIPFTGLPILTPLIGQEAVVVVAIGGIISNIVLVPATLVLLSAGSDAPGKTGTPGIASVMRGALTQPVVLAPILGLLFVLVGLSMPAAMLKAFQLLGGTVGGVSLFASGIILKAQKPGLSWAVAATTAARILAIPGLALVLLALFGVGGDLRTQTVLSLALPAASMQIILSVRYGVAERENASFLLFSNVLSIPTLALFIWLVG